MPAELETKNSQLKDEVLEDELEEELEDDSDDDEDVTGSGEQTKRKRRILHEDNVYVYEVKNKDTLAAQKAARAAIKTLKYEDHDPVQGFRVFNVTKDGEYDSNNELISGEIVAAVLARNTDMAARMYAESRGYDFTIAFRKSRGGKRGPRKIDLTMRNYGILLERLIFKGGKEANGLIDNAPKEHVADWNRMYAAGGTCGHYRDENGNWKEPH